MIIEKMVCDFCGKEVDKCNSVMLIGKFRRNGSTKFDKRRMDFHKDLCEDCVKRIGIEIPAQQ